MNIKKEAENILNKWCDIIYKTDEYKRKDVENNTWHKDFKEKVNPPLFYNKQLVISICEIGKDFLLNNDVYMADLCDEKLLKDREVALKMLASNGDNIMYLSSKFKNDKEMALVAVQSKNFSLKHVGRKMRDNEEVIKASMVSMKGNRPLDSVIKYASKRLKDKEELINIALSFYGANEVLKYVSKRLQDDKETVLKSIIVKDKYNYNLQYASKRLRNDKQLVLEAVKISQYALKYATEKLRNDREVVLEALKNQNHISSVSEKLRNDPEIHLIHKNNNYVDDWFEYFGPELKSSFKHLENNSKDKLLKEEIIRILECLVLKNNLENKLVNKIYIKKSKNKI